MTASVKAFVFDVYGTLFDVYSVKEKADELYNGKGYEISMLWRQKQLEYSFLRQLMGKYDTFSNITRDSLRYTLYYLNIQSDSEKEQLLIDAYKHLSLFPEVKDVLTQLKHKKLAVFSNGSRDMLDPLIEYSSLRQLFDKIISVDDIKQYKPTPASYGHALHTLGLEREEILFMSSNGWDISGARNFGFKTAWINRKKLPLEELDVNPHHIYSDLSHILEWVN
ncbi:haloacid dehalogenase type II [Halalkalibacter nanhaiisediminis]|uniref:2-haloacid dehalogenase n=1 Tax=Halalkalibacter nanhaiisediminis TaxID=688079 RepID=A0A562QQP4_9BACI|nr:haloacid dehalogenase type II [Halalkalibacter nanhaiisediminis]TWI59025.1 2-haloacid dehalogenase [Halalkalibacter nanhaiisediminis]